MDKIDINFIDTDGSIITTCSIPQNNIQNFNSTIPCCAYTKTKKIEIEPVDKSDTTIIWTA